jgi:hypothetical protein
MSQHATACHIIIAPVQCSHQKGATPVLVLPTKVQAEGVVLLNTDRIGQCAEKSFFFKVFEGSWLEREHNLIQCQMCPGSGAGRPAGEQTFILCVPSTPAPMSSVVVPFVTASATIANEVA